MTVNKLVTPFSLILSCVWEKWREHMQQLWNWKAQVSLNSWYENILNISALNLVFSDLLRGDATYSTGMLWRVHRVSLGQSIIFTGNEVGHVLLGNFGDLNYHVRTKCSWNVRCVASLAGWADSKAWGRTLLEHWNYIWCFRTYKKHRIKPRSDK